MYLWTDPELLRASLRRWYGAKTRRDRFGWTDLLDCNYSAFRCRVSERVGRSVEWREAISLATYGEMERLRSVILQAMIDK